VKLSRAATLTQGRAVGEATFERVSIDSRQVRPGDLFIAIRGDRFDGHDYAAQACVDGAVACVVDHVVEQLPAQLVVADTRKALGQIAREMAAVCEAPRVAVTGNSGKTTVKEMIACMLGEGVHATRGNFNNDIGVPLTLMDLRPSHRYAVFELGANAPGEIAWTSSLVQPRVALITNVTGAHLEGFGSMEGIAAAKSEIFLGMSPGDIAIINADDRFATTFEQAAHDQKLATVRTGLDASADFRASDVRETAAGSRFALQCPAGHFEVTVPLPGRHQVSNALMALAVIDALGLDLALAIERLADMQAVAGRMSVMQCRNGTLVDDAYNANPGSVKAAIDWLSGRAAPQVLILGDMGELGADSARLHRDVGTYAADHGIQSLVAVGTLAGQAAEAFGAGGISRDSHLQAANDALEALDNGGTVLVKGSRSAGMEAVITHIKESGGRH
jgi:UDP-N-acetylmuramoyl-tripeptide--D-alanyl-D-alanine ligase